MEHPISTSVRSLMNLILIVVKRTNFCDAQFVCYNPSCYEMGFVRDCGFLFDFILF